MGPFWGLSGGEPRRTDRELTEGQSSARRLSDDPGSLEQAAGIAQKILYIPASYSSAYTGNKLINTRGIDARVATLGTHRSTWGRMQSSLTSVPACPSVREFA